MNRRPKSPIDPSGHCLIAPWLNDVLALALLASLPASALAGELVIRDDDGREIGRVEPSPATPGLATIRGRDGTALGTVEDPDARQRAAREGYEGTLRTIAPARPDRDAGRRR